MGETPRFFLPDSLLTGTLSLGGEEARHARQVLRLGTGDCVLVCDGRGREALCRIVEFQRDSLLAAVESVSEDDPEPELRLCFYPSLSKGERFPWMLQKLCELGASEITPVFSERCVVRDWSEQKAQRFRRILWEAAKQCGRRVLPVLHEPETLETLLRRPYEGIKLFCHEAAQHSLSNTLAKHGSYRQAQIFTGPEGGYSSAETELACESGFLAVSLGRNILRCETAPLVAAAVLFYANGQI